jgi:hypothetical protein
MMHIDTEDRRLTAKERHLLRQIATRLEAKPYLRPVPEGYQRELDRVFGSDCESETNRWER